MTRMNAKNIPAHLLPVDMQASDRAWAEPETPKYRNRRTWSEQCQRHFDSAGEARRAEELHLLWLGGIAHKLEYQVPFELGGSPFTGRMVSIVIDYGYIMDGMQIYEDFKGFMTEAWRIKAAWLWSSQYIRVWLTSEIMAGKHIAEREPLAPVGDWPFL